MKYFNMLIIFISLVFFSACTSAYASHHGDRAGRYNNMPYRGNYYYNNYRPGNVYMGRPYRRF